MEIDWSNPKSQISEHFTVHDATYLPTWRIYHQPSEAEKKAILETALKLEQVRSLLERPLNVHCWIRPSSVNCPNAPSYHGRNYNALVGGAKNSPHIYGQAVDFNPLSMTCGDARAILVEHLSDLGIRMENIEGNWVHIDTRCPLPGHPRFFRP